MTKLHLKSSSTEALLTTKRRVVEGRFKWVSITLTFKSLVLIEVSLSAGGVVGDILIIRVSHPFS